MALFPATLVSTATYNNLPLITEAREFVTARADDLAILRDLLTKHKVADYVCIRLIHKHFDVQQDEVMVIEKVEIASQNASVQSMRPIKNAGINLHGIHYVVDDKSGLQPYEYVPSTAVVTLPNIPKLEAFVRDFCRTIVERGLQRMFGLKLRCTSDTGGWTEFEYPEARSTIMIPHGLPTPESSYLPSTITEFHSDPFLDDMGCKHAEHSLSIRGTGNPGPEETLGKNDALHHFDGRGVAEPGHFTTMTEFHADPHQDDEGCVHCTHTMTCKHPTQRSTNSVIADDNHFTVATEFHADPSHDDEGCSHCKHVRTCKHQNQRMVAIDPATYRIGEGLYFAGQKLEVGSPFHNLVSTVIEAW